jgi:hypothetical protein
LVINSLSKKHQKSLKVKFFLKLLYKLRKYYDTLVNPTYLDFFNQIILTFQFFSFFSLLVPVARFQPSTLGL